MAKCSLCHNTTTASSKRTVGKGRLLCASCFGGGVQKEGSVEKVGKAIDGLFHDRRGER